MLGGIECATCRGRFQFPSERLYSMPERGTGMAVASTVLTPPPASLNGVNMPGAVWWPTTGLFPAVAVTSVREWRPAHASGAAQSVRMFVDEHWVPQRDHRLRQAQSNLPANSLSQRASEGK